MGKSEGKGPTKGSIRKGLIFVRLQQAETGTMDSAPAALEQTKALRATSHEARLRNEPNKLLVFSPLMYLRYGSGA